MSELNTQHKSFSTVLEKIRKNKKIQYILIASILVIMVMFFVFDFGKNTQTSITEKDIASEYVLELENRLSSCLSKVKDAGKVSVVISVESGMETVLATDTITKETSSGIETQTTPIVINGKTVVVKEMYPKITGVLIVAEGAKNLSVMNRLQQATMSLLDIDINQIQILSMN